ncbi:MAG: LytTR family transcriptional regulator [Kangiellaceae bacterium]|nr:LytTR family transcriptional regulator [Kangiellaceae bacterium]MCW8999834.1 LytTR family transcriptional regulator [Kangiellaceae bacterium]MCW9015374.1 LytTR family transcriptional regulator [Kangiellaceae bacterium]
MNWNILLKESIFHLPYSDVRKVYSGIAIFLFSFLILFRPFSLEHSSLSDLISVALLSAFVFVILGLSLFQFGQLLISNYSVLRNRIFLVEITYLLVFVVLSGVSIFVARVAMNKMSFNFENALTFQGFAFAVSPLILLISRGALYIRYLNRNLASREIQASQLFLAEKIVRAGGSADGEYDLDHDKRYILLDDIEGQEKFNLDIQSFYYAKAEGNYVNLRLLLNGKATNVLIRITLKNLLESLQSFGFIYQCHRSYLVNLSKVVQTKKYGNKLSLVLTELNEQVPVSRGRQNQIAERVNKASRF